jgi:hypothetical protein
VISETITTIQNKFVAATNMKHEDEGGKIEVHTSKLKGNENNLERNLQDKMESDHDKTSSAISIDLTQIIVSIQYIHMSIQVLKFCDLVTFVLACITLIVF